MLPEEPSDIQAGELLSAFYYRNWPAWIGVSMPSVLALLFMYGAWRCPPGHRGILWYPFLLFIATLFLFVAPPLMSLLWARVEVREKGVWWRDSLRSSRFVRWEEIADICSHSGPNLFALLTHDDVGRISLHSILGHQFAIGCVGLDGGKLLEDLAVQWQLRT